MHTSTIYITLFFLLGTIILTCGNPANDQSKRAPRASDGDPPGPGENDADPGGKGTAKEQDGAQENKLEGEQKVPVNCSGENCTDTSRSGLLAGYISDNKDMLMRTFYVFIGVTSIIVVYFIVRTIRVRRKRSKSKKYGLLASNDDSLEMTPLDQDEDEDDLTVFEVNGRHK